jgi:hypothetical protein
LYGSELVYDHYFLEFLDSVHSKHNHQREQAVSLLRLQLPKDFWRFAATISVAFAMYRMHLRFMGSSVFEVLDIILFVLMAKATLLVREVPGKILAAQVTNVPNEFS